MRLLHIYDIHDTLKGKFVEIQTVTHVIVRRHCLRIIVYHYTAVTFFANCIKSLYATPVKLYRRTNTISAGTKYNNTTMVVLESDIALYASVCNIQVVGLCRVFCRQGVYLLHYRYDAVVLAQLSYNKTSLSHAMKLLLQANGTCYLEISKAIYLGCTEQLLVESINVALLHILIDIDDVLQFLKEPLVYLRQLMDIINTVSLVHCLRYYEDTLVCRLSECCINIVNLQFLVLDKAMHALSYHTESLLYCLLKVTAYSHNLTNRLHRRTKFLVYATELAQVPTRNLADDIVESRLKECTRCLCYGVLQFKQSVAHTQLCCNKSERITCSF